MRRLIPLALCLALPGLAPAQDTTKDEVTRLRQEVEQLRKQLATQTQQNEEQARVIERLRREFVEAQLQTETLRKRNEQLLENLDAQAKALAQMREILGAMPKDAVRKPPSAELEGSVTAVDEKGGLLTLNLGSKAGLQVGHTLEIFRLKPDAKYLGTIRILDVRETSAIAKPLVKPTAAVQVGDRVASRIR